MPSAPRAPTGPGLRLIHQIDGIDEAPRLLSDRRPELVASRTQCFNWGHVLLAELLPGASPPSQSSVRRKVASHAQERAPVDLREGSSRCS